MRVGVPTGSLWRGSADLSYRDLALGRLTWAYRPQDLLRLRIGYQFTADGASQALTGTASASSQTVEASIAGTIDSALLADLLRRYDIIVGGTFEIPPSIDLTLSQSGIHDASGELHWSGGPVSYRLGNTTRRANLPPLVAYLESPATGPSATVYAAGDDTPLMLASVQADGWVSIGVTRRFTELVGQPWSGSQPPSAVIMEVQEKLF